MMISNKRVSVITLIYCDSQVALTILDNNNMNLLANSLNRYMYPGTRISLKKVLSKKLQIKMGGQREALKTILNRWNGVTIVPKKPTEKSHSGFNINGHLKKKGDATVSYVQLIKGGTNCLFLNNMQLFNFFGSEQR